MPRERAHVHLVDDRSARTAAAAAHRLPSRTRRDRPRRSSARMAALSPGAAAALRLRPPDGRCTGRTGRAGPCRDRTAALCAGSNGPSTLKRVHLAGSDPGNEGVPVVIGAVRVRIERDDARRGVIVRRVEEQQLDGRAALGEDAEVHAAADTVAPSGKLRPGSSTPPETRDVESARCMDAALAGPIRSVRIAVTVNGRLEPRARLGHRLRARRTPRGPPQVGGGEHQGVLPPALARPRWRCARCRRRAGRRR